MEFANRMGLFKDGVFSHQQALRNEFSAKMRIIDMGVGTPDLAPPAHVMKTLAEESLKPENYAYAIRDLPELRQAAADWYRRRYGVSLDPASQIVSLLGSQDGLVHIGLSMVNEGDTVLIPDPCYPAFADGQRIAGADIAFMPMREEKGFIIDLRDIPEETARRARFMIISYPNNPTSAMAPDEFYRDVISFARQYDIAVLHDNAYSDIVFDGNCTGSFLRFEGAQDIGVEFNSLSKNYGMAGIRMGFCLGNADMVKNLTLLKSNMDYGAFIPIQRAAVAALTGDQSCVSSSREAYRRRRDLLCDGLTSLGWKIPRSRATIFVWAHLPDGYTSSQDFCDDLIRRAGVIVTPGCAFGAMGEGFVRISLTRTEEEIRDAIDAIRDSGILA